MGDLFLDINKLRVGPYFTLKRKLPDLLLDRAYRLAIGSRAIMNRRMLKSKIHRATVTDARVHYEGSITIDEDLMDAADILEYEEVHVWDVSNGARLVTYAIPGERGSGIIATNGAAALLVSQGDLIIIGSFCDLSEDELEDYCPRKVFVDAKNRIVRKKGEPEC